MRNLRSVDLNLLVALDAFVAEPSVTRAAARLGLSQPAASNMLSRLRVLFEDPLLVRTSSGMQPTERARELHEALVPILRGMERLFESRLAFDPATTTRSFSVRMSDVLVALFLPLVTPSFLRLAPQASMKITHLPPHETLDALEADRLDLAVSMGLEHGRSILSRPILRERMVCVMRAGHEAERGEFDTERFLAQRHVRVSVSANDQRFVDHTLSQMTLQREVALQLPYWTLLPSVLEDTDLVSVVPESLMRRFGPGFVSRPLPFPSDAFDWCVYWHRRHEGNPAQAWLVERFAEAGEALKG